MPTEKEILTRLARGYAFPPLTVRLLPNSQKARSRKVVNADGILAVTRGRKTIRYFAEIKAGSSPRIFTEALERLEVKRRREKLPPLLVVPYLSESQLQELDRRQISGIDLCGNGIVTSQDGLFVYRSGAENKFPASAPTKYAYRGATSLVPRVFLCRPSFSTLGDISQEIERRGGKVATSTISKAIQRLESDVIVDRAEQGYLLRQADTLLEKLAESYTSPRVVASVSLRFKRIATTQRSGDTLTEKLDRLVSITASPTPTCPAKLALSGTSSLSNYAVAGRSEQIVLYTSDLPRTLDRWADQVEQTDRFPDIELKETDDPTVYFDLRSNQGLSWASPVQVFLECMAGEKRDRDAAGQVRELILRELQSGKRPT